MSLFDKDFKLTFEASEDLEDKDLQASEEKCEDCDEPDTKKGKKAPAKKKDDEEGDNKGEEEEEPAEEPTEADMKEAAALVDSDLECDSLLEMRGPVAIHECEEDVHYLCLEAVAMQIAMDKTDQKLTEAYVVTEAEEAKEEVKRSFKESLKRYWERFKGFMERVRLAIARTAQRVWAYIRTLASKAGAKIAARGKFSPVPLNDKEIDAPKNITKGISELASAVLSHSDVVAATKSLKMIMADPNKEAMSKVTIPEKDAILKDVLGESGKVKAKEFGNAVSVATTLKNAGAVAGKIINGEKKKVDELINATANRVKQANDLDTKEMTIYIAAINKRIAMYNRCLSVLTSIFVAWIGARVRALKIGVAKESFEGNSLFEQFMAMTE